MVKVPYLRLNIVDEYNKNMNSVDIADQMRGVYRWDTFMRKRKWWWSILFWCLQMLQTNSYIMYRKYMMLHSQQPISHLQFCKAIALAWLDPHNNWPRHAKIHPKVTERTSRVLSESSVDCSSTTTITTRSSLKKRKPKTRARRFSDVSLHPVKGNLNDRLHQVQHWPVAKTVSKAGVCQLHRWASGGSKRKRGNTLFKCSYCEVTLCGRCFLPYHTVSDLQGIKETLRIEYGANNSDEEVEVDEVDEIGAMEAV